MDFLGHRGCIYSPLLEKARWISKEVAPSLHSHSLCLEFCLLYFFISTCLSSVFLLFSEWLLSWLFIYWYFIVAIVCISPVSWYIFIDQLCNLKEKCWMQRNVYEVIGGQERRVGVTSNQGAARVSVLGTLIAQLWLCFWPGFASVFTAGTWNCSGLHFP